MQLKIKLNQPKIINKVTNDRFGLLVAKSWKTQIDDFTPRNTGLLMGIGGQTVDELPFKIHYKENYAHYMYMGIVYVDPTTGASGFLTDEGWKSRFKIKKIKSNRKLKYQKINPNATDHWDIKAAEAGRLNNLYTTLNTALRSGDY